VLEILRKNNLLESLQVMYLKRTYLFAINFGIQAIRNLLEGRIFRLVRKVSIIGPANDTLESFLLEDIKRFLDEIIHCFCPACPPFSFLMI
jgi:hypothetical protein